MSNPLHEASAKGMNVPSESRDGVKPASRHLSKFQKIPALLAYQDPCLMKLYWWIAHFGRGSARGCWASVNTLASHCRRDKRRVQEDLARLRELGLIYQIGVGPRGTNCWALVPDDELPVPKLNDSKGCGETTRKSKRKRKAHGAQSEWPVEVLDEGNQRWQGSTPTGGESASSFGGKSASKQETIKTKTSNKNPEKTYRDNTADAVLPTAGLEDEKAGRAAHLPITHDVITAAKALLRLATGLKTVMLASPSDVVHWQQPTKGFKEALKASADHDALDEGIHAIVRGLLWSRMMGSPVRNQMLLLEWITKGASGVDDFWAEKTAGPTGDPMGPAMKEDVDEVIGDLEPIRWSAGEGYFLDSEILDELLQSLDDQGYWKAASTDEVLDFSALEFPTDQIMGEYLADPEEEFEVA